MPTDLFFMPFRPALDSNMKTIPGAQVWFTLEGTNTPTPIYSDVALTMPHTNPVVASAVGRLPPIYLDTDVSYRVRVYDEDAQVGVDSPIEDYDPYIGVDDVASLISDLADDSGSDALGADMVGWSQLGTGAVGRTVRDRLRDWVSVKDFGAIGDGVADDNVAFEDAIAAVNAAGGGVVYVPQGSYLVGKNAGGSYAIAMADNVGLMGAGPGSIITLADGSNAHVINASNCSNIAISNLIVQGNRANQSTGHGIRFDTVTSGRIQNVRVEDSYFYGIGLQGGGFIDVTIDNVEIDGAGSDGIDIKNNGDLNSNIRITNVTVRGWAIMGTGDVAVDCRGPCQLSNIAAIGPANNDCGGIRFRPGELLDVNGYGGHDSSLTNFYIDMGATTLGQGLRLEARNVTVTNGHVKGGLRGIYILDSSCSVGAARVEACSGDGVTLVAAGSGLDADECVLVNVRAASCGGNGFTVAADRCQLIACQSIGNTGLGIEIQSGADTTFVIGGQYTGNTAGNFTVASGTNSQFHAVRGFTLMYNVAGLPTGYTGQRQMVQDANATTFNSTVAGGGSNVVPVFYNGSAWKIG